MTKELIQEAKKDFNFYSLNFSSFPINHNSRPLDFEQYFKGVWMPQHKKLVTQ